MRASAQTILFLLAVASLSSSGSSDSVQVGASQNSTSSSSSSSSGGHNCSSTDGEGGCGGDDRNGLLSSLLNCTRDGCGAGLKDPFALLSSLFNCTRDGCGLDRTASGGSVCGADNVTYMNACLAFCQGIAIQFFHGGCDGGQDDPANETSSPGAVVGLETMNRFGADGFRYVSRRALGLTAGGQGSPPNTATDSAHAESYRAVRVTADGDEYLSDWIRPSSSTSGGENEFPPGPSSTRQLRPSPPPPHRARDRDLIVIGSDDRAEITDASKLPYSVVGMLNLSDTKDASLFYVCTGILVNTNQVLTSAQCLYDRIRSFWYVQNGFYPGRHVDGGTGMLVDNGGKREIDHVTTYQEYSDPNQRGELYDLAVVTLKANAGLGYAGVRKTNATSPSLQQASITGYAGDKTIGSLWNSGKCAGTWGAVSDSDRIVRYDCDTSDMEGSPILSADGYALGLHTFFVNDPGGSGVFNVGSLLTGTHWDNLVLWANLKTAQPGPVPPPTAPVPTAPVPTAPVPTAPVPTAPVPTAPVPTAPVPTAPVPTAPVPTAPVPTAPVPTAPTPAAQVPVAAPTKAPTVTCFSGQNLVETSNKGIIEMHQLEIGDSVRVQDHKYARVYAFGHYDASSEATYLQITTTSTTYPTASTTTTTTDAATTAWPPLEISSDHLVLKPNRRVVRAGDLQPGDRLPGGRVVTKVDRVQRVGRYAPATETGTIVVSGILASNYVSLLPTVDATFQQHLYHTGLFPLRFLCQWNWDVVCSKEETYTNGISNKFHRWVQMTVWMSTFPKTVQWLVLGLVVTPVLLGFTLVETTMMVMTAVPSAVLWMIMLVVVGFVWNNSKKKMKQA